VRCSKGFLSERVKTGSLPLRAGVEPSLMPLTFLWQALATKYTMRHDALIIIINRIFFQFNNYYKINLINNNGFLLYGYSV